MFSTLTHTTPITPATAASDAQVHAMLAELRNAVGIAYISPNEVVAAVTSNSSSATTPTVNGTPTGAYLVAYYY
jgi:hypothetical protein